MNSCRYGQFAYLLLLLAATCFGLSIATSRALCQEVTKYAHEFYHDFRGKPLAKELHVVGMPEGEFIKEEAEGFRITLPRTWIHGVGGVGCRTNFGIKGDFEVTGTFEILRAEEPLKGFGVGATLRVQKAEPHTEGATLARVVRAGGNQILVWDRVPEKGGKTVGGVHPCAAKLLRLRLKRTGTTLHYQWAPGLAGDDFEEIRAESTFGDNEVIAVRMSALTGRVPCEVDVRFIDLRIRSGGSAAAGNAAPLAPAPNNLAPAAVPDGRQGGWIVAVTIIGLVLLAIFMTALGSSVYLLRRRKVGEPASGASTESEFVTFPCPACGKTLKAKAAALGKKIKCAKCGNVVIVPVEVAE